MKYKRYFLLASVLLLASALFFACKHGNSETETPCGGNNGTENSGGSKTPPVNTTALTAAITEAKNLKDGVQVIDTDTTGAVEQGTKFVKQQTDIDALEAAIAKANEALSSTEQEKITNALTALNTAIEKFKTAKKIGTKLPTHPKVPSLLEIPKTEKFSVLDPKKPSNTTDRVDVAIESFWMCEHEVTQKEYKATIGSVPSGQSKTGDDFPVEKVTWLEAIEYCNKRSADEHFDNYYHITGTTVTENKAANGYRLPTAEEWEYAARAGIAGALKYSGAEKPEDDSANEYGWYENNSGNATHEVMTKKPNKWGLYDMSGNVAELVFSGAAGTAGQKLALGDSAYRSRNNLVKRRAVDSTGASGRNANNQDFIGFRVCRNK